MPFYIADENALTAALSTVEFGAYVLLKGFAWRQDGALPTDESKLARLARLTVEEWEAIAPAVLPFFPVVDGFRRNVDLDRRLAEAKTIYRNRKRASTAANKARWERTSETHSDKDSVTHSATVSDAESKTDVGGTLDGVRDGSYPQPQPQPQLQNDSSLRSDTFLPPAAKRPKPRHSEPEGFAEWYEAYPRHEDRGKASRAYAAALKFALPADLLDGAKRYRAERNGEDQKFTKLPATWLNAQSWLNEPPRRNGGVPVPSAVAGIHRALCGDGAET